MTSRNRTAVFSFLVVTLAIIVGLSVGDVSKNGINLGWKEINIPAPVFEGDTVYAQTEILRTRESKSRPTMGIVGIKTTGFKQDGTVGRHRQPGVCTHLRFKLSIPPPRIAKRHQELLRTISGRNSGEDIAFDDTPTRSAAR